MACPAMGACFWFARSEDSNSCAGDRRLRRKQGAEAGAAVGKGERVAKPAPVTATRKTAPQRRNQQSCGLLVSPRESPRGMRRSAGPDGGSLTESVGLLFCCYKGAGAAPHGTLQSGTDHVIFRRRSFRNKTPALFCFTERSTPPMTRYFMRDTPLCQMEQQMMTPPYFKPRGHGRYYPGFKYSRDDMECP